MDKPRITADELAQKLVGSRKIMKKVDTGDFEKGAISEKMITSSPEELMAENAPTTTTATRPVGKVDPNRVNESKLPDAIKRAMIENPIPQIGLNDSLDMNFVNKARALMEADGQYVAPSSAPSSAPSNQSYGQPTSQSTNQSKPPTMKISANDLTRTLTPIIENIIRKTLDDIVDKKMTQILMAQETQTINEGLAIKVGDTIFTGKLTKAKSVK